MVGGHGRVATFSQEPRVGRDPVLNGSGKGPSSSKARDGENTSACSDGQIRRRSAALLEDVAARPTTDEVDDRRLTLRCDVSFDPLGRDTSGIDVTVAHARHKERRLQTEGLVVADSIRMGLFYKTLG